MLLHRGNTDTRNYWGTSDDELLAEEMQTFVWARRRRGSTRGGLGGPKGAPEGVAGSGCLAAPDLGFGLERILGKTDLFSSAAITLEERNKIID